MRGGGEGKVSDAGREDGTAASSLERWQRPPGGQFDWKPAWGHGYAVTKQIGLSWGDRRCQPTVAGPGGVRAPEDISGLGLDVGAPTACPLGFQGSVFWGSISGEVLNVGCPK